VGLDLNSVNFSNSTIRVLGKRNKERVVPFGAELRDELLRYIELRKRQEGADATTALLLGPHGGRISRSLVEKTVHTYLSQVTTLKKRSPHVLRHTFATAMLNNGAEIEVVRQLLGHKSITTTEIYTHTTFEELKKAYAKAHPHADKDGE
jgi:integrase/recombinase XerC